MIVETKNPAMPPQVITAYTEMEGIADNIPAVIPTPIPMIPKGMITSNAPKKGMRRILSGRTSIIPINPPKTMAKSIFDGLDRSKNTTSATKPPENVPMKKSAIFKFINITSASNDTLSLTSFCYLPPSIEGGLYG